MIITAGGILINENKKILLVLRPQDKKAFPNTWAIPGGKVENGESLEEAVKREVLEETGLGFTPTDKYTFSEYLTENLHTISHIFFGTYIGSLQPETKAQRWSYKKLQELPLAFNQEILFKDLYNRHIIE